MVEITEIIRTKKFEKEIKSIRTKSLKEKIKKQIKKILDNPLSGKPLKYDLKGERTVYVKPYRIIYAVKNRTLYLLRFEHRQEVYK